MEKQKIAICPGSFDPITTGHLDIITRASALFSEVIVLVVSNVFKSDHAFSVSERMDFINRAVSGMTGVRVDFYDGLLADYAAKNGAAYLVKGLRAVSDFEYEFQMAHINKRLNRGLDTVFLPSSIQNTYVSSSLVRQVSAMGGDIKEFVPPCIVSDVSERMYKKSRKAEV